MNNMGVPQGSILGPLLFLFYINDLPKCTKHQAVLFADDSTIVIKCTDRQIYETNVNNALGNIIEWMDINGLCINLSKTNIMQFHSFVRKPKKLNISFDTQNIEEVMETKFLGLTIDSKCDWKAHIDDLCTRLSRFVYPLKRIINYSSENAGLMAYFGYVQSILSYGLMFWGNSVNSIDAFRIQKRCVRALCGLSQRCSCKPLFHKYGILPLPCLYIKVVALFVKKHINLFETGKTCKRNLRNSHKLVHTENYSSTFYHRSFYYMSIKIYNRIPDHFKELPVHKFKIRVTEFLLFKLYYSVEEFLNDKTK